MQDEQVTLASDSLGMQLYLALLLLAIALFLLWRASRQRRGRPSRRPPHLHGHTDGARSRNPNGPGLGLTGKPDYLVQSGSSIIPVEVKSGRAPAAPYDSHIFQVAAYCLLVEKTYGKRPPYGIIHYSGRDFAIDYTRELESALLDHLARSGGMNRAGAALP
jgi:CRISPR-associated exonuclease Cas4